MGEGICWTFFGYMTPAGGRAVQEWFDALQDEEKDAIRDVVQYLKVTPRHLWVLPDFESFDSDLSEIRVKVGALKKVLRIYGCFWPENQRYSYTLLLGKQKKVKNDKRGAREARARLQLLRSRNREVTVHEFRFFENRDSETAERKI